MSNTTLRLRRQLASAADLQAVVRTMKAVAAANIGQYERSVEALADYCRAVDLGLGASFRDAERMAPGGPSVRTEDGGPICAIVFGSDQGLVGRFNDEIAEHAVARLATLTDRPLVWAVGERVGTRLLDSGITPVDTAAVPNSVQGIAPLVGHLLIETEQLRSADGLSGQLHLFNNRPGASVAVEVSHRRLLPLDAAWRQALTAAPWPTQALPEPLGSPTGTLRALIREHLFISMFRACAESLASENASRLTAMERAEKNIDQLLGELRVTWQRLRQRDIDEELFDVIAGFEALGSDGREGAGQA
ncbi:MAG TPA: F0F1 ATP synthase subunit gamma [Pseudomonadales bacterium]|nr:F0F1 ATP synthase subunit gamma [Pseudomonadales bacterium]